MRGGKSSGIAQRWNEKGFGFIKPDDGGDDLFCHYSNIEDGNVLEEGAAVEFVKVGCARNTSSPRTPNHIPSNTYLQHPL